MAEETKKKSDAQLASMKTKMKKTYESKIEKLETDALALNRDYERLSKSNRMSSQENKDLMTKISSLSATSKELETTKAAMAAMPKEEDLNKLKLKVRLAEGRNREFIKLRDELSSKMNSVASNSDSLKAENKSLLERLEKMEVEQKKALETARIESEARLKEANAQRQMAEEGKKKAEAAAAEEAKLREAAEKEAKAAAEAAKKEKATNSSSSKSSDQSNLRLLNPTKNSNSKQMNVENSNRAVSGNATTDGVDLKSSLVGDTKKSGASAGDNFEVAELNTGNDKVRVKVDKIKNDRVASASTQNGLVAGSNDVTVPKTANDAPTMGTIESADGRGSYLNGWVIFTLMALACIVLFAALLRD